MVRIGLMMMVIGMMSAFTVSADAAKAREAEAAPAPLEQPQRWQAATPLKCLTKRMVSYCIPNTYKYQVCTPTVKQVECPIDSYCKEYIDLKGNNVAYCKYIG